MTRRRGKGKRTALILGCLLVLALGVSSASVLLRRSAAVSDQPQWTDWDGTVVFLGDSITDFCDLGHYYPGLNAVNEGISGQTTGEILDRMERSVYAREPDAVVVLAGINDLFLGYGRDQVLQNLLAIVQGIRQRLPGSAVLVQSLYPVGPDRDPAGTVTADVKAINGQLEQLAGQYGYRYVDLFGALSTEDGFLDMAYSDDELHPNDAGYRAVQPGLTRALNRVIAEQG